MATAAPAVKTAQAPPAPLPFRVGTQPSDIQDYVAPVVTTSATTQQLPVYHPTADSFQRGVWLQVNLAYTSNVVATIAFKADGPWNVLNTVSFTDVQQRFIVGPLGGFDLYCVNLLGGYFFQNDPKASAGYNVPLTSTPLTGSFSLYLPLEVENRDALGSLENKSTASTFNVNVTVETAANIWTTPPTNPATVTVTYTSDSYLQPAASDAQGNPLSQAPAALGSTQFWAKSSYNCANGSNPNVQLTGGLGYPIRNIILENYDVAGPTRSAGETAFPSPLTLNYKGVTLFNRNKTIWLEKMARAFGFNTNVNDAAGGKPNGVYSLPFNLDFTNQPGAELRNGYLQTSTGSILALNGSWAAASTLYELCNYVVPANGNPGSIRSHGR
jgi:hypothetical protein